MTEDRLLELYNGTLELVAERGYEKLTMDQIAEATKSSKATLYRQWGSKSALVVEALQCVGETEHQTPDTGSLRGDLMAMVDRAEGQDHDSDLLAAIMHAVRQDAELAAAVREQILEPGRETIRAVVQRAVARGEIAADCAGLAFVDYVFIAPIVLHHLFEGDEPSPDFLRRYVDGALLPALGIH
ncbi:TetR/AcrR family transcriptional regulator [Aeromicrobium wangtongii]|uniref:TetR/AcrR family transcriptional regulator n=1 Tax=Aeromicrobium wangtongii TaxID=2969247 RepID=UPI0020177721|nr:TetR/AcrR family transcriptional regulator [Aeromicrobium wangtongii]MCL3816889.1 TetR/AcrR family transcriptional regulator [Aeromicrobium wangtongii]